mmetsp:Transcript_104632/g.239853  ORF Transcript_104632/g.239853 Transcript_104632/m.239853 type:complete len:503 (-) Transcript_104632:33-1541(-)
MGSLDSNGSYVALNEVSLPARVMPILRWLPAVLADKSGPSLGSKLGKDAMCALTVTAILVPQAMAYSVLAEMPPQWGLYTAMMPLLVYMCFGSSRHLAVGPFAVISLLNASAIQASCHAHPHGPHEGCLHHKGTISVTHSFVTGVIMVLMSVLKLGCIAQFLSDPVLSGFCTACSILIPMTQLKYVFGIKVHGSTLIPAVISISEQFEHWNLACCGVFMSSLVLIYGVQKLNKKVECLKKRPIPAELLGCVVATVFSGMFSLDRLGVQLLGFVPTGLPSPTLPSFESSLLALILPHAMLTAIMIYATSLSVSKVFAKMFGYEIDGNQELMAFGMLNLAGSFTSCFPAAASLSRTAIVGDSGAATPIHGAFTVLLLCIVVNVPGQPLFNLPKACLAAIVVLAFKSLLLGGIAEAWRMVKETEFVDLFFWSLAFLMTLLAGVVPGLGTSVSVYVLFCGFEAVRDWVRNRAAQPVQRVSLRRKSSLTLDSERELRSSMTANLEGL